MPVPRFRFDRFLLSPAHRSLRRDGTEEPLIPRYFDLLVLLVAERHRVVTRQEIFDRVWSDVVVSDGALSQAIRTIRRALRDDPREPRFIRTVARHGYQFVAVAVTEEPDHGPLEVSLVQEAEARAVEATGVAAAELSTRVEPSAPAVDRIDQLLDRLLRRPPFADLTDEERREAAEELHALGTAVALGRLDGQPGHAEARAILRDARWDVAGAGDVALLGGPDPVATIAHVVRLRFHRARRQISNRWGVAALGGVLAGVAGGLGGGIALFLAPASAARPDVILALVVVGALAGALGATGVGAGLATAEALARSSRLVGLGGFGALGGLLAGLVANLIARAVISGMFGRRLPEVGGWLEGLVLGGAAGLAYGWATSLSPGGGLAAPRGWARVRVAAATGLACAAVGVVLTLVGFHFVASTLDIVAGLFDGSSVGLGPLAQLLGEGTLKPLTRTMASAFEGLLFGAGLAFGLTHRPANVR